MIAGQLRIKKMKLTEISDEDKVVLIFRQIKFDFLDDYKNISETASIVGKSVNRRLILKSDIDVVQNRIHIFLGAGFSVTDPDIVAAKEIYDKLSDIKNRL